MRNPPRSTVVLAGALMVLAGVMGLMMGLKKDRALVSGSEIAKEETTTAAHRVKFVKAVPKKLETVDERSRSMLDPSEEKLKALEALRVAVPGVQADFDPVTRAPSHVQATGKFLTPPSPGKHAREVVEAFVDAHSPLFGHGAGALKSARVTRDDVSQATGMTTLVWNQEVVGIPVFKTILKANVTRKGELITINDHFVSEPQPNARQPLIAATRAISLAAGALNDEVPEARISPATDADGEEQMQRFTAPGQSDTSARLTYLPMNEADVRLGWEVTTFSLSNNAMFCTVVDAVDGTVLYRTSLTSDLSDASFRVFADAATKKPLDSPRPMSPGHPTPLTTEPAEVSRNLVTLQAMDVTASPNGWINDGGQETLGNNVDAHTDTDFNNVADLPRPNGGPARVFDFNASLTSAPSSYKDAVTTNLFYLCNWAHDRYYQLGFTESAGNFQTDNFGLGGLGNDAVQADAQDGAGTSNANFSTPTDGSAGRMQMYVWTAPEPDRDGALDSEVVIHEYTHGLISRLVGGGVGITWDQAASMAEGWADFYALCVLGDPADDPNGVYAFGAYTSRMLSDVEDTNYYFGVRRYPYCTDLAKNPLTYKDIDIYQASAHAGVPFNPRFTPSSLILPEVHSKGEVWCSMLWDVRAALIAKRGAVAGNERVLQLVTNAMKLCPVNPTFVQSRDAILQADLVLSGGADSMEIMTAFARRGLGVGATSPLAYTTTGVVESYDLPDALTLSGLAVFTPVTTRITGPTFPSSQSYTLTNTSGAAVSWSAAKTQPWLQISPVSGTLAPGGSVNVTATTSAGVTSLAAGNYADTITFTNLSSGVTRKRSVALTVNPLLARAAFFPLDVDPLWSRQGEWAFGQPTGFRPPTGYADPSRGFTGSNVFGIVLTGLFSTTIGDFAYLTSGPINTTGMSNVALRFKRWLNESAQPYNYATIEVSDDGVNWTTVWQNSSISNIQESGWSTQTLLLGAVANNKPAVQIRWGHRVGAATTMALTGWNIDDVEILSETFTPSLAAISQNVSTPVNTPVSFVLSGTDSVTSGATLTTTVLAQPSNGTLSGTAPELTYTPNAGFSGVDTIPFTVSNGATTSAPSCVVIRVLPGPPDITVEQPDGNPLTDGVSSVDFGPQMVGLSLQRQFRISNTSGGPLNLLSITIDGSHAAEFAAGATSQALLAPGQSTYLQVTFSPVFVGVKHAALHIGNNDPDEAPFDIALTAQGTALDGGVLLTRDISTGAANINSLRNVNGRLLFVGTTSAGTTTLWTSQGTAATTLDAYSVLGGSFAPYQPEPMTVLGSRGIFYTGSGSISSGAVGLWMTDGTLGGGYVFSTKSFYVSYHPSKFTQVGDTIFFTAGDTSTQGMELWKTNGTDAGTVLVKDINPTASASSSISSMVSFNGQLWFAANDGVNGTELWMSDGTTAGTVMVKDINPGSGASLPANLKVVGSTLFFSATTSLGTELWKSDGTALGTVLLKDIYSGSSSSTPQTFVSAGNTLFFAAVDAAGGMELWKSDGTATGTVMVKDITPGSGGSSVVPKFAVGSTLYFSAFTSAAGAELWKSDGTATGTVMVKDINPGSASSNPLSFVQAGSLVYFTATDGTHGTELWQTDGTAVGTVMLSDVNPGSASSTPGNLTVVGSQLYFTATLPSVGTELFVLDLGASPEIAVEQPAGAGLVDGAATVDWGGTLVNGEAVTKFFVIKNSGPQPLEISEVMIDGTGASCFSVSSPLAGARLQPGGLTAVGVSFLPNSGGAKSAGLHIISDDLDEASFDVALTGSGVLAPEIVIESPTGVSLVDDVSSLMIGDAPLGLSVTRTFAIRNAGSSTLLLTGMSIDGMGGINASAFAGTAPSASSVAPGGIVTCSVTFAPVALGAHRALLHLTSNDADEASFDIGITGTGSFAPGPLKLERDLNQQGSGPTLVTGAVLGGCYYYAATTSDAGTELWRTDGTASGTIMFKDINPGAGSSFPGAFAALGGVLYFTANDGVNGTELWKSDGTSTGTVMVKNINTVSAISSSPSVPVVMGGAIYFAANDGPDGSELWRSDGTNAGTVLVKDIASGTASSSISSLTVIGNMLFFSANDGVNGTELWKSDGTTAGTVMVKDINTTAFTGSNPAGLRAAGSWLVFSANDGVNGMELWRSDGTAGGTSLVLDISPGTAGSAYLLPTSSGNLVYFVSQPFVSSSTLVGPGQELWRTDGTAAGTFMLADIRPGYNSSGINGITADGLGGAFVAANDGVTGTELWHSDGTSNGTALVKDVNPGSASSSPTGMTLVNGLLYFSATTATNGAELWRSDGTAAGTFMLRELNAGEPGSSPGAVIGLGSSLIFTASNGGDGSELWALDASGASPRQLHEYVVGTTSSSPSNLRAINGRMCFIANDGVTGTELWSDDGSGPVLVKDIRPGATSGVSSSYLVAVDSLPQNSSTPVRTLYFVADDGANGFELWKTDGTAAGTVMVKDIYPGSTASSPANLVAVCGHLFFSALSPFNGVELWTSDGTEAGTQQVANINTLLAGTSSSSPANLTAVGATLFFTANDGVNGTELWKSDGSLGGTVMVKDIVSGSGSTTFSQFAAARGLLFFTASDGSSISTELWMSDGTPAGTYLVKDINPTANASSSISSMTAFNDLLFFSANDGVNGTELWRSDGTFPGTSLVKDINTGSASSSPGNFKVVGSTLFFSAATSANGTELWKTDGTGSGTVLVKDIFSGASTSVPSGFANIDGMLYFSAAGSTTQGAELWKSDGTANGTVFVADMRPGANLSSSPSNITQLGSRIFFTATGTETGVELWSLNLNPAPKIVIVPANSVPLISGESTLDFGTWASIYSTTQTLTLRNDGDAPLAITGSVIDGANGSDFTVSAVPATVGLSAATTFTVTCLPSYSGVRSAVLHIITNDPDRGSFDLALTGTLLSPYQTAYQAATEAAGLPASGPDTAPLDDYDGDGVCNLIELAFGTNPDGGVNRAGELRFTGGFAGGGNLISTGSPTTLIEHTMTGDDIRAVFVRRKDAAALGITYTVQFTSDFTVWEAATSTPVVLAENATHEVVSVSYPPVTGDQRACFFRVVVDVNP